MLLIPLTLLHLQFESKRGNKGKSISCQVNYADPIALEVTFAFKRGINRKCCNVRHREKKIMKI